MKKITDFELHSISLDTEHNAWGYTMSGWKCVQEDCDGVHHYYVRAS